MWTCEMQTQNQELFLVICINLQKWDLQRNYTT